MSDTVAEKRLARRAAALRRDATVRDPAARQAQEHLRGLLAELAGGARAGGGAVFAGYLPIKSEIDPLPVLAEIAGGARQGAAGRVCMPVITGPRRPLKFRHWWPGCALAEGPFGARVPADGDWLTPDVLVVPLLAFDRQGGRLGYGGGYYDRTLAALRAAGRPVLAIGFAFAAQEAAMLPYEATDQPMDAIVTELGVVRPGG